MTLGAFLSWMVCGLIVGLIARGMVPGRHGMGWLLTMVLGMLGAVMGGCVYSLIQGARSDSFALTVAAWQTWLVAIVGAVLVLGANEALNRSSRRSWR